jgi:hypothetical protein
MMTLRERAKADYLEDPQIKEVIDSILKPHLSKKEAIIVLQFGVPRDRKEEWEEAVAFASTFPSYSSSQYGRFTRHRLEFLPRDAQSLFKMYQQVEDSPHLEIFIDNMKLPCAATLWLPLLWFYL